ncbi:MAG: hypothetical protein HYR56_04280 [Acidobacteria bacterium]|nr:hypothetical protein [Acidobacteriota bacterium]MBI3421749.1 hypothetical protein [Acidobacteriota bacterium]
MYQATFNSIRTQTATLLLGLLSVLCCNHAAQAQLVQPPRLPASLERGQHQPNLNPLPQLESATSATAPQAALTTIPGKQWAALAGPETGLIASLARKGSRVFAGTTGGVYLSDDAGESWQRALGSPATQVYGLLVNGDAVLYGTDAFGEGPGGVLRSTDDGATWQLVNNGLPEKVAVLSLAAQRDQLFAATVTGRVFRSADNGDTWTEASTGLPETPQPVLLVGGPAALLALTNDGLYRTTDGGASWANSNDRLPAAVKLTPGHIPQAQGDRFLLPTTNAGVIVSDDGGATWRFSNQGMPENANLGDLTVAEADVYCATSDGALYRSTDGGATWTMCNPTFGLGKNVRGLERSGDALLLATFDGVFRSMDDGASWERANSGLRAASMDGGMLAVGNRLYVSTQGGIWASDTKGASWRLLNDGFRQFPLSAIWGAGLGYKDGCVFAGSFGDGLYRSANGGNTWELLSNGLPEFASPAVIKTLNGKLYVGYWEGGAYVSTDNGDSFQPVALPADAPFLTFAELGGSTLLAGSYGGGMFRSDDDGASWRAFKDGIRNDFIDDINVYRGTVLAATDDGIYRLNADGEDAGWTELLGYAETITGGANALIRVGRTLYATTYGRGIAMSNNNGASWYSANQGMTTNRSFYFARIDNDLFVATAGGGVCVLRNVER